MKFLLFTINTIIQIIIFIISGFIFLAMAMGDPVHHTIDNTINRHFAGAVAMIIPAIISIILILIILLKINITKNLKLSFIILNSIFFTMYSIIAYFEVSRYLHLYFQQ
jgi:hypothetical protein